ncbi:MAG: GNAT family N-acetyltransferase [Nitriliruptoraceae bacterium]
MIEGLRPVDDADRDGLIRLIGSVFAEYPGCVLDLDGLDHDLLAPGTEAQERDSPWWVVERSGRIVATVGAGPLRDDGTIELKRLYVDAGHRREGLATALVKLVEQHARRLGARAVDLWSDTRFEDAHRLYTRLGYRDTGERRHLEDPSDTTERHFERRL